MPDSVADAIRHHVGEPALPGSAHAALLAVVDECEQMRTLSDMNAPIRWAITDRIESVIARELGIEP